MGMVRLASQATVPETFDGCEYPNFLITIDYQHYFVSIAGRCKVLLFTFNFCMHVPLLTLTWYFKGSVNSKIFQNYLHASAGGGMEQCGQADPRKQKRIKVTDYVHVDNSD
jgi:hypothetical protein